MEREAELNNDIILQRYLPLSDTRTVSTITNGFTGIQEGTKMAPQPKSLSQKMSSHIAILLVFIIIAIIALFLTVVISVAVFSQKLKGIPKEPTTIIKANTQPLKGGVEDNNFTIDLIQSLHAHIERQEENINNISTVVKNLQEYVDRQQYLGFAVQDFVFDKSTSHTDIYISKDRRTISNRYEEGMLWVSDGSLQNYYGVIGRRVFTKTDIVYFEIEVYYKLWDNITFDTALIFEVGFSTEDTIDGYHYLGGQNKSWSFMCINDLDSSSVVLAYEISRGQIFSLKTITSNVKGETYQGRIGFFVDGPRRKIAVYDILEEKLLKTFENVEFEEVIHPVFGVFNGQKIEAKVTLHTRQYIKAIPKWLEKTLLS